MYHESSPSVRGASRDSGGMNHIVYMDDIPMAPTLSLRSPGGSNVERPNSDRGQLKVISTRSGKLSANIDPDLRSPLTQNEASHSSRGGPRHRGLDGEYDYMQDYDGDGPSGRILVAEQSRQTLLQWRQSNCYIFYCCFCFVLTIFLFVWNIYRAHMQGWNIPKWRHHLWEEYLEILLSLIILSELAISMWLIGCKDFFQDCELIFGFFVMAMTLVTIAFALFHIIAGGAIFELELPFLIIRFILQPLRLWYTLTHIRDAHQMHEIDDIQMPLDDEGREFYSKRESELPVY